MARPGIMLYFDVLEPIKVLPDEDKGKLLVAMLEYGQSGIDPQFTGMLALAWGFVKPKLDKDSEEYRKTVLKRQFATVCRDRKKNGEPDITFEEWLITIDDQNHHMISHDIKWYPTTTTTTATTTTTTTATAAAATTNDDCGGDSGTDRVVKVLKGELGKGVVFLSNAQVADLLEKMDIDAFDHYVDKLSTFIISNGARVKSHYDTILKWWREDGAIRQ